MKHSIYRTIAGTLLLFVLLLEAIMLCGEALMPGQESAAQSGAVGDIVDDFMTDFTGEDGIRDVPPEEVLILGGEEEGGIRIPIGAELPAKVRILPEETSENHRKLSWASADPDIVSVRNGTLCANALGVTTVTVALANDPDITASATVTVEEIYAEEFSLAFADGESSATLPEGRTAMLLPRFSPCDVTAEQVQFSSSDDAVATVDEDGVVRAKGTGDATITAIYQSLTPRGKQFATLRAEAAVRVIPSTGPVVPPAQLSVGFDEFLQENDRYIGFAGTEGTFRTVIGPDNCTDRLLVWESSDESVLEVEQDGSYRLNGKGTATLSVYSALAPDVALSASVEVRNRSLGLALSFGGTDFSNNEEGDYLVSAKPGMSIPLSIRSDVPDLFVKYATSDAQCAEISDEGTLLTYHTGEELVLTVTVADNVEFSGEDGDLCETMTIRLTVLRRQFSDGIHNFGLLIRKIFGHFSAFLILGMLAGSVAACFDPKKAKWRILSLFLVVLFGFAFAGLTEILQLPLFTAGRGAAFRDVLIDFSGYLPGAITVYGGYLIVSWIVGRVRARKTKRTR